MCLCLERGFPPCEDDQGTKIKFTSEKNHSKSHNSGAPKEEAVILARTFSVKVKVHRRWTPLRALISHVLAKTGVNAPLER
ncbi:hypothetical protein POVWA2_026160 [Plasmodium ovale wallikeri]|uniref:Uncharacterized protein n=1 Tax=Plasmodium ovale wallikeri TaxID=864142 RepID=A0A1A8YVV1_PLAOA|nr:hypothetical protein POVWA1_016370 [Plasmodium ovale wallikeri]SBT35683.1 hypothetical protein POVWA2_026160 [Plasmodium ovale wallikeri]